MYNFLLIDDSEDDRNLFFDTITRLNLSAGEQRYCLDFAKTYDEGMSKVSDELNGIIVDIQLDPGHSGNEIVRSIVERFRVPVAIFTGTPDTDLPEGSPISVFKKGAASHEEILDELCAVSDTGMFNVLGGTGTIERMMTQIFWKNLYPQLNLWKEKHSQGKETESVLLRYAISHIQELLDSEVPAYETEEMYICPPVSPDIKTGAIFQSSQNKNYCIVLSPPCDLAMHSGKIKTDRILICEIDNHDAINRETIAQITKQSKKENCIQNVIKNNFTDYYHWLPQNSLFEGGYINFRKIKTCSPEDFMSEYGTPKLKVQEFFVKNILNRFSAYYARQGQPDFNFKAETDTILSKLSLATVK